jgi:hypothetical protein
VYLYSYLSFVVVFFICLFSLSLHFAFLSLYKFFVLVFVCAVPPSTSNDRKTPPPPSGFVTHLVVAHCLVLGLGLGLGLGSGLGVGRGGALRFRV